jgi:hypothetical protein
VLANGFHATLVNTSAITVLTACVQVAVVNKRSELMIIQNNLKFPVSPSFATPASDLGVGPLAKLNEKLVASGGLDKAQASVGGRLATPSYDAFRRANLSPLAKMLERMTAGMDDGTETHGPSDDGYPSEKAPQDVSNDGGPSEHVPRMPQDDGHGAVAALAARLTLPLVSIASVASRQRIY